MSDTPQTFEEILAALEAEVRRLESGELPLEESLAAFERGMGLVEQGGNVLAAAEKKVEMLLAAREGETRPFDPEAA